MACRATICLMLALPNSLGQPAFSLAPFVPFLVRDCLSVRELWSRPGTPQKPYISPVLLLLHRQSREGEREINREKKERAKDVSTVSAALSTLLTQQLPPLQRASQSFSDPGEVPIQTLLLRKRTDGPANFFPKCIYSFTFRRHYGRWAVRRSSNVKMCVYPQAV